MESSRSTVEITLSVWRALFLREALTRLSGGRVAWLWLFLEPIAHVALLMVVFSTIRGRSLPGLEFAIFLALGALGFTMFSGVALRSTEAISANMALFAYRQVKPVDTVLVRIVLEGLLHLLVSFLLLAGAALVGLKVRLLEPLNIFLAAALLWGFGAGTGLMLSVAARLVPEVAKVVRMLFGPLHLISGVFFAPFMVPPALRGWLMLNPIPHGLESLRSAFLVGYPATSGADLGYLAAFAMGSIFFGLALHVRFARRLTHQ